MKLGVILLAGLFLSHGSAIAAPTTAHTFQQQVNSLSSTLAHYNNADAATRYHAYKAKMWLSYAVNEHSESSLTVAGQEAMQHAQGIDDALKNHQAVSLTTPVLSVSQVMRRDLWQQAEYLKQHGALEKAPERLAHAEVMLVWAAAEYCELGWRHAKEHFNAAEQALYQVVEATDLKVKNIEWNPDQLPSLQQLNGQGCSGVNSTYWPLLKEIDLPVAKNSLTVPNVVHFALDRAELSLESQKVLDQFITVFKQYPELSVTLLGYTDSRANQHYNLRLAQRRIDAVQAYLLTQGITKQRIQTGAKGATDLQIDEKLKLAHAKSRRVVLQLNDASQIQIETQWQDLQLELEQQKVKVN
ncbi:OmpA family protein [Acinetobacter celticus]|uniref:OmpA-like domain-containing protein n=1 Tax=Acinetobacter celticus TaxID=1891224 RepID=A0A1C3D0Z5_9GAMM|nr:OmpA family protein [Acinetobacter celticus]ODA14640.1 hypothetical protein BBP83_02260 [Acinetobacter celticus]